VYISDIIIEFERFTEKIYNGDLNIKDIPIKELLNIVQNVINGEMEGIGKYYIDAYETFAN